MYTYHDAKNEYAPILNYLDPLKYFAEIYHARRKLDAQFSYEIWAAQLGMKSSSYLRLVCGGKRPITEWFIETYSNGNQFSTAERDHFFKISKWANATSKQEKEIFKNATFEKHEINHEESADGKFFDCVSNPLIVKIHTLTGFADQQMTVASIAQFTGADENQILEAIGRLTDNGLVRRFCGADGVFYWRSTTRPVRAKNDLRKIELKKFHAANLKDAVSRIGLDENPNQFRTLFFALSDQRSEEFKNDVDDFMRKIKSKYGSDQLKGKELYQLNLQSYPAKEPHLK